MTRVMAVTFEPRGQLHYLDPGEDSYAVGDWVLYPTTSGPEVAQVVWAPEGLTAGIESLGALPGCAGRAEQHHLNRDEDHRRMRARIETSARALIADHALAMKVVAVDYHEAPPQSPGNPPDRLAVVYYTAPERVDFRALVGELAAAVESRVDLRQIGDRDAARVLGGIGTCGRDLCCASFLTTIEPVGMRLAKEQQLPANPLQIAGACGRLKCCLAYEHPLYRDFADRAPPVGTRAEVGEVSGQVVAHHVPDQTVSLRADSGEVMKCPLSAVCSSQGRPHSTRDQGRPARSPAIATGESR